MGALREVYRRSSLSNDGDRANLLAHPDALELSDLSVREGRTRTAVADDRIAGFATWLRTGDRIELEDLFVDPEWMRRGAGPALGEDLVASARSPRIPPIHATPHDPSPPVYTSAP